MGTYQELLTRTQRKTSGLPESRPPPSIQRAGNTGKIAMIDGVYGYLRMGKAWKLFGMRSEERYGGRAFFFSFPGSPSSAWFYVSVTSPWQGKMHIRGSAFLAAVHNPISHQTLTSTGCASNFLACLPSVPDTRPHPIMPFY